MTDADYRRACRRGAIIGLVLAAHTAAVIWLLLPRGSQPGAAHATRAVSAVMQVELLVPAAAVNHTPSPPLHIRRPTAAPRRLHARKHSSAIAVSLQPAPSSTTGIAIPAFIAGGTFGERLRRAEAATPPPKLPGGQHYTTAKFKFVPAEQQSIEGKVNAIASMFFGGFDPVCKNTAYELAKTRKQMLADGYTMAELQQRLREHHCQ